MPFTRTAQPGRALLLRALDNGHRFRTTVLRGRRPEQVDWSGGSRSPWTSDVPRDLTVDGVYFIQAKYDSTCVLNTSPAIMVDHLLLDDGAGQRQSWYEKVALDELQEYYRLVRLATSATATAALPDDVRQLDRGHRGALKTAMRARTPRSSAAASAAASGEDAAYRGLCRAVSLETEWRWEHRLRAASISQRTQMLFRMLRIAGGPYWLLGTKGASAVRLAVTDTRSWRDRFTLQSFEVTAGRVGQPQVDWRATVADARTDRLRCVEGYCEIRWSHGKLQGNPECKVQVTTPLSDLPGYEPLA
jgi:hypothetical protein